MPDSDFGDWEPDDAYDVEAADPLQVAIKLHRLRRDENLENVDWDRLDEWERGALANIATALLAWMRRQGAD